VNRRHFLHAGTLAGASLAATPKPSTRPFVGLQIAPFNLLDEGIERCLDRVESAGVNALFLYSHTYYGIPYGRPPEVLADDRGIPIRDESKRKLWPVWVRHDPARFQDTPLRFVEPDPDSEYLDRDIFRELQTPLERRGIKLYARVLEPQTSEIQGRIENWDSVRQVDLDGKPANGACRNHPDYRAWWVAMVRDLIANYRLDGYQWGAEHSGPLAMLLSRGLKPHCFCRHCAERAGKAGIDLERAREGFRQLHPLVAASFAGEPGPNGGLTHHLLQLLLRYPEILAWETLWRDSLEDLARLVYETAKESRPELDVGRHIDSKWTSLNPISRAGTDAARLAGHADFIKPILYHDVMGPRMKTAVERWRQGALPGLEPEPVYDLLRAINGYDETMTPPFDRLDQRGFGPEYVAYEVSRLVEEADARARILAGIGVDVPAGRGNRLGQFRSDPKTLLAGIDAALDAGSAGILLSREYDEMHLATLKAVGEHLRGR